MHLLKSSIKAVQDKLYNLNLETESNNECWFSKCDMFIRSFISYIFPIIFTSPLLQMRETVISAL